MILHEVQKEAFEDGADLLIATTSSDEINILACLVAKKLGTQHTIARIRNPEYEKQLRFMRDELGLSMIINPEKTTAREIARVLRFPSAIKREQFCRQRFELIEYRLAEDNPLVGLQLADLYRNIRVKILICAVARGSETIIPTGAFTLQAGDKVYLTASARDLEAFFRKLNLFKAKANNVMIVGASRMAYYLVKELQDIQKRVTVIDNNPARCQEMSEKFPGVLVIHGDGADAELLSEERITETQRGDRSVQQAPDRVSGAFDVRPGDDRRRLTVHGHAAPAGEKGRKREVCRRRRQPLHRADARAELEYARAQRAGKVQLQPQPRSARAHQRGQSLVSCFLPVPSGFMLQSCPSRMKAIFCSAMISPFRSVRSTLSSAFTPGNVMVIPRMVSTTLCSILLHPFLKIGRDQPASPITNSLSVKQLLLCPCYNVCPVARPS